jgi:hypothetical protein
VAAQTHSVPGAVSGDTLTPTGEKMTLEQIFLRTVGNSPRAEQELSWLG